MIDLHTHTNCSDGMLTPGQLIKLAADSGLTAMSITDHDTIRAYDDSFGIVSLANDLNIELIAGIEFSTVDESTGQKIHVIGLDVDTNNKNLKETCNKLAATRREMVVLTENKLKDLGIVLRSSDLLKNFSIITKTHIVQDILDNPENTIFFNKVYGKVPLRGTFIEDYLIKGKPAFVGNKDKFYTDMAIDAIHQAGGKAFCAHPSFNVMRGFDFDKMKKLILHNKFDGVEIINIQYDKSNGDIKFDMVKEFTDFAKKNNLLMSGGSDFHSDDQKICGNHSSLGLANEDYKITKKQLELILGN